MAALCFRRVIIYVPSAARNSTGTSNLLASRSSNCSPIRNGPLFNHSGSPFGARKMLVQSDPDIGGIAGYGVELPSDHPRPTGWGALPGSGVRLLILPDAPCAVRRRDKFASSIVSTKGHAIFSASLTQRLSETISFRDLTEGLQHDELLGFLCGHRYGDPRG